jgi:hypothetical protein
MASTLHERTATVATPSSAMSDSFDSQEHADDEALEYDDSQEHADDETLEYEVSRRAVPLGYAVLKQADSVAGGGAIQHCIVRHKC